MMNNNHPNNSNRPTLGIKRRRHGTMDKLLNPVWQGNGNVMQHSTQQTKSTTNSDTDNSAHDDEEEVDISSPSSEELRALEEIQEYQQNNTDDGNIDTSPPSPSSQSNDEKSEEESEEECEEMPSEEEEEERDVNVVINNNNDSSLINDDVNAHDDESVPEETKYQSSDVLDCDGGHDLLDASNNDSEGGTSDNAVDDSTVGDNNETTNNNIGPIVNNDVNHQLLDKGLVEDGGDAQAGGNNNLVDEEVADGNNEVGPPTYTDTTFFMSMFHGMTIEQYRQHVQSLLNNINDINERLDRLSDMIVQTTHWHKMRFNGLPIKPFITAIHDSLTPTFDGLPTADNLRNRYNGYVTGSPQPPVHPPMHLPPTIKPINVHASGTIGQCCIRGEGECFAGRNNTAPTFHQLVGNQYCDICSLCLSEEYALDISATFASKELFHQAMTQHANRRGFAFRKIQGNKNKTTNLPVTLGARCAASNNHHNCGFHIEVSFVGNEYHYSKLVLGHSTDDT